VAFELLAFEVPVVACLIGCFVSTPAWRAFQIQGREGAVDAAGPAAVLFRPRAYGIVFLACWLLALVHRSCAENTTLNVISMSLSKSKVRTTSKSRNEHIAVEFHNDNGKNDFDLACFSEFNCDLDSEPF
jgi:hypothetical protein